jgi:hypothetical protein
MTLTHERSKEKQQARRIRRIVFLNGFRDRLRGETVCRLSRVDVLELLNEPVKIGVIVPDLVKGEILVDSRGNGSFQR